MTKEQIIKKIERLGYKVDIGRHAITISNRYESIALITYFGEYYCFSPVSESELNSLIIELTEKVRTETKSLWKLKDTGNLVEDKYLVFNKNYSEYFLGSYSQAMYHQSFFTEEEFLEIKELIGFGNIFEIEETIGE